jgi:DNA-binding response OmpR family regulator
LLRSVGYDVLTADSGHDGVEALRRNPVRVAVLDYQMPGLDGEATAVEMRRAKPEVSLILMTAHDSPSERVLALFNAYIPKNSPPSKLMDELQRLYRQNRNSALK